MNNKPTGPGWTRHKTKQQGEYVPRWTHRARRINVDIEESCPISEWHVRPVVYGCRITVCSWGNLLAQDDVDFVRQALGCQGSDLTWPSPDQCSFAVLYEETR